MTMHFSAGNASWFMTMHFSAGWLPTAWLMTTFLLFEMDIVPSCHAYTFLCRYRRTTFYPSVARNWNPLSSVRTNDRMMDFDEVSNESPEFGTSFEEEDVDDDISVPFGQLDDLTIVRFRDALSSMDTAAADTNEILALERLLLRWVEECKARPCNIQPQIQYFIRIMQAWQVQMKDDPKRLDTDAIPMAIQHLQILLSKLRDLYHSTDVDALKPNVEVFRIVLRAMKASRERQVDRKAERLFQEMQTMYGLLPDSSIYESLIYMLAKSRNNGAANRAERLLREAVSTHAHDGTISVDAFNVVITAWAKSGIEYGPERAEKLIVLMSDAGIEPTISSFTSLIDSYSQTNTWEGSNQCERIFNRVLDMYLVDGDKLFEPSVVSWSVVLSAWGKLAKKNHKGASERADKLFRRMELLHREGRISQGPDPILYVKCMNANAYSQTLEGLHRAKDILNDMNDRYLDGEDAFLPTARSILILIDQWVRSSLPNKMDEAESILNCYKEHLFTIPSVDDSLSAIYKSMVIGWANDGDPILAQEYLEEMVEIGLTPDPFCFEKVIESNTQVNDSGSMKRSYAVFQLLEKCRLQKEDMIPNERAYTSFIRAMIKDKVPNLARKSNSILQKMNEIYLQGNTEMMPTVFTYNAVLLACSESASVSQDGEERKDALKLAVTIFNDLRSANQNGCELDHVSFGNMLRCSKLLPDDSSHRDELIKSVFQLCCERGFVNQFILRDLYGVALEELRQELLGTTISLEDVSMEMLPSSWQRNVNQSSKSPNKDIRPSTSARRKPNQWKRR
jgi:hypothetical protein